MCEEFSRAVHIAANTRTYYMRSRRYTHLIHITPVDFGFMDRKAFVVSFMIL